MTGKWGSRQILDLSYEELAKLLVRPVEVLVYNNHEAEHLVGSEEVDRQLGASSFDGRVRIVVITAGEDGLYALVALFAHHAETDVVDALVGRVAEAEG